MDEDYERYSNAHSPVHMHLRKQTIPIGIQMSLECKTKFKSFHSEIMSVRTTPQGARTAAHQLVALGGRRRAESKGSHWSAYSLLLCQPARQHAQPNLFLQ